MKKKKKTLSPTVITDDATRTTRDVKRVVSQCILLYIVYRYYRNCGGRKNKPSSGTTRILISRVYFIPSWSLQITMTAVERLACGGGVCQKPVQCCTYNILRWHAVKTMNDIRIRLATCLGRGRGGWVVKAGRGQKRKSVLSEKFHVGVRRRHSFLL